MQEPLALVYSIAASGVEVEHGIAAPGVGAEQQIAIAVAVVEVLSQIPRSSGLRVVAPAGWTPLLFAQGLRREIAMDLVLTIPEPQKLAVASPAAVVLDSDAVPWKHGQFAG